PAADHAHAPVPTVEAPAGEWALLLAATPELPLHAPGLARAAGRARRLLPPAVHDALTDLTDDPGPVGALLLRGVPTGPVPPTPPSPTHRGPISGPSEFALLAVARALGQPVGFAPEHGGRLVQDLLPTPEAATRQTSTSSAVELEFHTETAFHPHRPRFLLLLCLRGEPTALTLLCSVRQILDQLPLAVRRVLSEPRYRTAVDESFTGLRNQRLGRPVPVLSGDPERPTLTFDADLMVGSDAEANHALATFRRIAVEHRIALALAPGDLLVVDNHTCIHGRSPFVARYDGTDRWLQRTFVVADLAASAGARDGRVITTRFV
ncbi:MAG: L-lysine 3-hydroxylase, partial [Acidimicrobiales bacterium]|nr:L-lysine 3-hydroxylase [Acidimicrobiales bacterium]